MSEEASKSRSEAGQSDASLENELFETGERSTVQTEKEGATEIICHGEYGGFDISMNCKLWWFYMLFLLMGTKFDHPLNNTYIVWLLFSSFHISWFGLLFDLTNLWLGPGYGPTRWFRYLPAPQHVLDHPGNVWILINQITAMYTEYNHRPPLVVHQFEVLTVTPCGWAGRQSPDTPTGCRSAPSGFAASGPECL